MPRSALVSPTDVLTLPRVRCPTCGAHVASHRMTVDYERSAINFAGHSVQLRRGSLSILLALVKAYPRAMTQDKLMAAVWGALAKKRSVQTLRVQVMHLRNALAPLSILINSFPDRNVTRYRLVLPDADTVRALVAKSRAVEKSFKQPAEPARPRGRPKTKAKSIADTVREGEERSRAEVAADNLYQAEQEFIDAIKEDDNPKGWGS